MRELQEGYAEAKQNPETFAFYKNLGRQATLCHQNDTCSFPLRSRRAQFQRGHGHQIPGSSSAASHHADMLLAVDEILRGSVCSLPPSTDQEVPPTLSSCKAELQSVVKHLLQAERGRQHPGLLADAEALPQAVTTAKAAAAQTLQQKAALKDIAACHWVQPPQSSHGPLPCSKLCSCFSAVSLPRPWESEGIEQKAAKWKQQHLAIKSEDWPHQQCPRAPPARCLDVGLCVCARAGAEGRFQRAMKARLQSFLRKCDDVPKRLYEGQVVLQFCGTSSRPSSDPSTSSREQPLGSLPSQHFALWEPLETNSCPDECTGAGALPGSTSNAD